MKRAGDSFTGPSWRGVGHVADGIAAALRALADLDAAIRSTVREVHTCAR